MCYNARKIAYHHSPKINKDPEISFELILNYASKDEWKDYMRATKLEIYIQIDGMVDSDI